ncbi:MAG: hypothetical protein HOP25_01330 [Methylotenera sp.]|nr:hypothetical protein [Methylotenera sp.]
MNPAARLLGIYDKLISQQKDQSMKLTWAVVFNLDENDPHLEDKVTSCVVALRKQIDFTSERLAEMDLPADLTSPGFPRFKEVASPSHLNASWNGLRGNIQPPECRQAFMWSSWLLRHQVEKEISAEDLQELLNEIAELEKNIADTEMSPILRNFIQQQIASINEALILSRAQGLRPIHEAVEKFAGACTINRDKINAEVAKSSSKTKEVFTKFGSFLKKTAEAADTLDKLKSLADNVSNGVDAAKPFITQLLG